MVQTLKLGSLYLDEKPVALGAEYQPGQTISFGEAAPDMAISWVPVNGQLIADRCILTNVSWDDLDGQGLVFGKEVKIQGFRFAARLLKVGDNEDGPNEWDAALDTVGEDDALWHWSGKYFWGQESAEVASNRVTRGYTSARLFDWTSSGTRFVHLGFRPALVPLASAPSALRHDQEVIAIGRNGCVIGNLVGENQYDLILRPKACWVAGAPLFAANLQDGTLAVDRSGILSIATA